MATYDEITNRIHGVYHRLRLTLNGTVLDNIPNNVEFNNTANDSSGLEIGTAYCSQIAFDIENPSKDLRDLELLIEDGVRDSDGTYVYKKLGYFQINSVKSDRGVSSYVCYDRMAYVFSGQYTTSLTFPTTDKAIIEEICRKCGVTLIGDLTAHTVSDVPTGTNRSVLTYMLQLQGKNAVFNADGNLEVKWYTQTDYTIDDSRIYSDGEADTASPFTVGYIKNTRTVKKTVTKEEDQTDYDDNGNEITKKVSYTEETSEEETYTAGTGLQGVSFNNPYMTQEIVNELYEKLKTFTYTPANFYVVGDYRVRAMDIITVTTDGGKSYTVPVMTIHHSCDGGLADTISAYGQSESESSSENESELSEAMTRYDAELAYLKTVYANTLNVNKAYIAFAEIKDLHATNAVIKKLDAETVKTIYLEAEVAKFGYVTADTVEAQYARLDKANIGTGWIDSAMIGEGVVGTVQIADGSITDAKIVDLTANKITAGTLSVERLEIRGTANSIVYALNNITGALQAQNVDTLNGEILTPRSITADRIVAEAITAKEIATDAITTNHILAGAVTADKIAVKAITADKMDVIDLSAISALIGGWALGEGYIRDMHGGVYTGLGRSGVAEAFFAGGALADGSDGVFRVGHDGSLYASDAVISGSINAKSLYVSEQIYTEETTIVGVSATASYMQTITTNNPFSIEDAEGYSYFGLLVESDGLAGTGSVSDAGITIRTSGGRHDNGYLTADMTLYASGTLGLVSDTEITINGKSFLDVIYPVGSIYMSVKSTNPGTLFGGTWVAWGSGRVPVGVNGSDTNFATVEKTGGASTVKLTAAQSGVPSHAHGLNSHTHSVAAMFYPSGESTMGRRQAASGSAFYTFSATDVNDLVYGGKTGAASGNTANNTAAAASSAHNNLQPYITCYMFKRTA